MVSMSNSKDLIEQITYEVNQNDSILVTGGHFMVSNIKKINNGTLESFTKAVEVYKSLIKRDYDVKLGVFINDIGLTCSGQGSCSIEKMKFLNSPSLPIEYSDILAKYDIKEETVLIVSERFLRNRAKRIFHSVRKRDYNIVEREEGYYFVIEDRPEIILTRKNDSDKYGTPACPLIMTAFGLEHKRMGFNKSINFYYIGNDNTSNIPNYMPIEKGKLLATIVDREVYTKNVYIS